MRLAIWTLLTTILACLPVAADPGQWAREGRQTDLSMYSIAFDEIVSTYGADTARWSMLSESPPERDE